MGIKFVARPTSRLYLHHSIENGRSERRPVNVSVTPDYRLGVTDSSCLLKRLFIRAFDGIDWLGIDLGFFLLLLFSSDFFFGDGGQKFSGTEMIQCCNNNEQMDKVKVAETLWLRCSSFLSSHSTICRAETNKHKPDGDEKTTTN